MTDRARKLKTLADSVVKIRRVFFRTFLCCVTLPMDLSEVIFSLQPESARLAFVPWMLSGKDRVLQCCVPFLVAL